MVNRTIGSVMSVNTILGCIGFPSRSPIHDVVNAGIE